jgi:hypothetical protein
VSDDTSRRTARTRVNAMSLYALTGEAASDFASGDADISIVIDV